MGEAAYVEARSEVEEGGRRGGGRRGSYRCADDSDQIGGCRDGPDGMDQPAWWEPETEPEPRCRGEGLTSMRRSMQSCNSVHI